MRIEAKQVQVSDGADHPGSAGRVRGMFRRKAGRWLAAAALSVLSLAAEAQDLKVESHTVAGGGGTSSGGAFTLSGTVGQTDAGPVIGGGRFALRGGFWSRYIALQTPGAPTLTITRAGANVEITWLANGATGYVLQETSVLGAGAVWLNAPSPVTQSAGINKVMIAVRPGNHFFRLALAQ